MRPLRFLILVAFSFTLSAQSTTADPTLQTLMAEVHQLRLAIERSTLLGARTQLATSQLQLDENRVARLSQELNDVRAQPPGPVRLAKGAEHIKDLEQALASPEYADPKRHQEIEGALKQQKMDFDEATATEQQRSARESDLANQLQAAQNQLAATRAGIEEMQKALDAAIRTMLKSQ